MKRNFIIEENQTIWDTYYNKNLESWILENKVELENQVYTKEEIKQQRKRFPAYNMPDEKITPYNCAYIKKKQSLQQYKPIILQFEKYIKKSFNDITANDIEKFRKITEKKNRISHFNGFMIYCIENEIIKNRNKEFLISLLPESYRKLGKLIAE